MEHLLTGSLIETDLEATAHIAEILRAVRNHLGMPFAFVSELVGTQRVFRYVDSNAQRQPFRAGDSGPLRDSYCAQVIDGRLPPLMQDTAEHAAARALPATTAIPVGAYISVPIQLTDGSVFGTFCCFSDRPDYSLNARDLELMTAFSGVIARQIERHKAATQQKNEKLSRIKHTIEHDQFSVFFQPIRSLVNGRLVGLEALSRFPGKHPRPPYRWFAEAWEVGLGVELEMLAIKKGLRALHSIGGAYVAVNVSPATVLSGKLEALLHDVPPRRLVLEITEHALVDDYPSLHEALVPLRRHFVRIAIDDAGSGYSTMNHIIALKPDLIKLDAYLTTKLEDDPIKRALLRAMVTFADEIRCDLVAEGIETEAQRAILANLGVRNGQGYLLGRPAPLEAILVSAAA